MFINRPVPDPDGKLCSSSPPASPALNPPRRLPPLPPELLRVPTLEGFASLLHRELGSSRRSGGEPALLLLSVRRLELGGLAGDAEQMQAVLAAMGERLRSRVRSSDVTVQIGARRFAVLLQNMAGADPGTVELRLRQQLAGAYEHRHVCLKLSLDMGWARGDRQRDRPRLSASELLAAAETALQADCRGPRPDERRAQRVG